MENLRLATQDTMFVCSRLIHQAFPSQGSQIWLGMLADEPKFKGPWSQFRYWLIAVEVIARLALL